MLASLLYSDRERAIKRCNISRFPINTCTHTEIFLPLTFYTYFWTSLTSMTLPNVPSPRVETISSERVNSKNYNQIHSIKSLPNSISSINLFGFDKIFFFTKLTAKRFYSIRLSLVLYLAVGYWIVVFWWETHHIQFPAEANFFFFKMHGFASISIFFNSFNMELKETPKNGINPTIKNKK